MKKISMYLILGFVFSLFILNVNDALSKEKKIIPPLYETKEYKITADGSWVPGGGEIIKMPLKVCKKISKVIKKMGSISDKDVSIIVKKLHKFFTIGGLLSFWHKSDNKKDFGVMYYKNGNDIRVTWIKKRLVIRFLLNKDHTLKKIIKVQM